MITQHCFAIAMQIKQFNFLVSLKYITILMVKNLKSKRKRLALTLFYHESREIWLGNSKKLIWYTNKDSTFSHTRKKNFNFLNNKPPATWAAHMTRNYFTCCSCSYHSPMVKSSNQTPSMNHCLETRPPPQAQIFSILLRNSMTKIRV